MKPTHPFLSQGPTGQGTKETVIDMQKPQTNSFLTLKGTSLKESMPENFHRCEGDSNISKNTETYEVDNSTHQQRSAKISQHEDVGSSKQIVPVNNNRNENHSSGIVDKSSSSQQQDVTISGKPEMSCNSQDTIESKATDTDSDESNASEVVPTSKLNKKLLSTDLDTITVEQSSSQTNPEAEDKPVPTLSVKNESAKCNEDISTEAKPNLLQETPGNFSHIINDMPIDTDKLTHTSPDNSTSTSTPNAQQTGSDDTNGAVGSDSDTYNVKQNIETCSDVVCSDIDSQNAEKNYEGTSAAAMRQDTCNPIEKETNGAAKNLNDSNQKIATYSSSEGVDGIKISLEGDRTSSVSSEDENVLRECQTKGNFATAVDMVPIKQSSSQQSSKVHNMAITSDSKPTNTQGSTNFSIEGDDATVSVSSIQEASIDPTQQSHDNPEYALTVINLQQPVTNDDINNIKVDKNAAESYQQNNTNDAAASNSSVKNEIEDIHTEEKPNLLPGSFSDMPIDNDQLTLNCPDNSTPVPNKQKTESADTDWAVGSDNDSHKLKQSNETCSDVVSSNIISKSTDKNCEDTSATALSSRRSQVDNFSQQQGTCNTFNKETDGVAEDSNDSSSIDASSCMNSESADGIKDIATSLERKNAGSVSSEDAPRECQRKEKRSTVVDIDPVEQSSPQQSSEIQNMAIASDSKPTIAQVSMNLSLKEGTRARLSTTGSNVAANNDDVQCENRIVPINTTLSYEKKHDKAVLQTLKDNTNDTTSIDHDFSAIKITHDRIAFQQYLKRKGFHYQASQTKVSHSKFSLESCLAMHTNLDVLDENNKFICQHCTEEKQSKFVINYNM